MAPVDIELNLIPFHSDMQEVCLVCRYFLNASKYFQPFITVLQGEFRSPWLIGLCQMFTGRNWRGTLLHKISASIWQWLQTTTYFFVNKLEFNLKQSDQQHRQLSQDFFFILRTTDKKITVSFTSSMIYNCPNVFAIPKKCSSFITA